MAEQCGTNRAYNRHVARGEQPDAACRAAHTAYNAARQAIQQRAYARLAKEFRKRYRELYAEERLAAGPLPIRAVSR